jgi:hypothetical protein
MRRNFGLFPTQSAFAGLLSHQVHLRSCKNLQSMCVPAKLSPRHSYDHGAIRLCAEKPGGKQ